MSTSPLADAPVPTTPQIESELVTTDVVAPEVIAPVHYAFPAVLLVVALGVAAATGVLRRGSINGPDRLDPRRPTWPLLLVFLMGLGAWFGAQVLFIGAKHARRAADGNVTPITPADLSAGDMAFLSNVPFLLGLFVLLAGDALVARITGQRLGMGARWFGPGLLKGLLGIVILMPVIFFASVALEHLYQLIGYEHPSAHELLTVMKDADQTWQVALLIVGATFMAPLFEELLFRGHLQTLLGRLFGNRPRRVLLQPPPLPNPVPPMAVATIGAGPGAATQELAPAPPPLPAASAAVAYASAPVVVYEDPAPDAAWQRWLVVILTSLVFALIHPLWSAPLIFVLSVGLGYAYERTGNLWVPVSMHLLFNSIQTTIYLAMNR